MELTFIQPVLVNLPLIFLEVFVDDLRVSEFESSGVWGDWVWWVVTKRALICDVHPDQGVIAGEVSRFKEPCACDRDAWSSPHSIYNSPGCGPVVGSGSVFRTVSLKDHVGHVVFHENTCYILVLDRLIHVTSHDYLISVFDPFVEFRLEIFFECYSRVSVVIVSL